ncbi:MAG TPA: helicase C-terminal domain-containing protein [Candidatus Limnocylindria bacterium]|nr:helicase C-terminal domain-containing protein [Candidatus Limnocylindria bacterium]
MQLVAIDLETTGWEPASDRIVEIGAVRVELADDGAVRLGRAYATLVDPGRALDPTITRLTGIRDEDLVGAPPVGEAIAGLAAFLGDDAVVGHNVRFDLGFLAHAGLEPAGALDTAELASILLPTATSYALTRLAADLAVEAPVAHRALADATTCALVLGHLARAAADLAPDVLDELAATAALLGPAASRFFGAALARSVRTAWDRRAPVRPALPPRAKDPAKAASLRAARAFAPGGPLAAAYPAYEDRPEQRALAEAIERTFDAGGVLVAEAGTGVGKSLAYLVPALARALGGERTVVSTHTLPLQDQLVRRDIPSLQAALGTDVPVAVQKGRSNYLCPRRWQQLRATAATPEEARLVCKTLVWRASTVAGERSELNLLGPEGALWARISADDESCTQRRCAATRGGCYLERARTDAAAADVVVVNHALLLHDARAAGSLLPDAEHVVVDEAHHLEDVAADAFGHRLEDWRSRRDLDRVARSPLVLSALRSADVARVQRGEGLREEVARAHERAGETFAALRALVVPPEERVRVTAGVRLAEETWLPVELAAERFDDALGGVQLAAQRLIDAGGDDDEVGELTSATKELIGARMAIARGIHDPRAVEIAWLEATREAVGLYVAPSHVGGALRRLLVDRHRSLVLTSATLAVAGSLRFATERFGVADIADELLVGSPFDHATRSLLVVPADIALPHEEQHPADVAYVVEEVARALGGRTLVLFTAHTAMRDVARRLEGLADAGIAVLTQGVDGSRRALLDRFAAGSSVLLGTRSFWEGVDLPGDLLQCVLVTRIPFDVPDDPLVEGRAERYDDPFNEYQLPQAALRLRQGAGRLIRTATDRGAIVLLDRRIVARDYGPTLIASLPPARLVRTTVDEVASVVARHVAAS